MLTTTSHIRHFFLISFMMLGIYLSIGLLQSTYAAEAAQPVTSAPQATSASPEAAAAKANPTATAAAPASKSPQQQVVAEVVWVKGDVKAVGQDKKERPLKRRDFIYEHDTLNTGPTGSGQIVFTDSSLMALQENSSVTIDKYKYNNSDKNHNNDEFVASLAKGGFRTITGAISKARPENYKLATPVATIGVRGTEYVAILTANGLTVKIEVGSIVVSNKVGAVILTPNNEIYARIVGLNKLPEASKTAPANFKEPAPLQPTTPSSELQSAAASTASAASSSSGGPSSGSSGSSSGGSSSSGTSSGSGSSSGSGGSRTVGSFCIS